MSKNSTLVIGGTPTGEVGSLSEAHTKDYIEKDQRLKLDAGKVPWELLPGDALRAIAVVLGFGAKKYYARGWEEGMDWSRVFGAIQRHLWAWWQGESKDPETGYSHLWHAGCCIVFLIAYEERSIGKDDRPKTNI